MSEIFDPLPDNYEFSDYLKTTPIVLGVTYLMGRIARRANDTPLRAELLMVDAVQGNVAAHARAIAAVRNQSNPAQSQSTVVQ